MIDFGQLLNGLWMGALLILLGLTPGLLDKCAEALLKSASLNTVLLRILPPTGRSVSFAQPRWLALTGVLVIAMAVVAYVAR